MTISAPFIRRPVATSLLAVALALVGLVALRDLPVSALPRVDMPTVLVSASQPGADPQTMAATVAAPLERRIGLIAGVTELTSTSATGSATIIVQFDLSRSVAAAARDIQAAINAARQDLPALPSAPIVRKLNPADMPAMILGMTSTMLGTAQVYDIADTIVAPRLSQVSGVATVQVMGSDQPAIRIAVDPLAAAAAGVSLESVRAAIVGANVTQPLGAVDGPLQRMALTANGALATPEGYGRLVLRSADDAILRLSSIASASAGSRNARQGAWLNNQPGAVLLVFKQADANVIEVADGTRRMLESLREALPGGTALELISDRSVTIRASVAEVERTLFITAGLVILVVSIFLRRIGPVLAASAVVPLSLLGTLAVMWLLGYSLNNLSLMALTISVGFVVDDAIVMIENIARMRERGMAPMAAAIAGARGIGFTVVSITLSLLAVFIPLLVMPGLVGRLFREFSMTLATAVAISAVVSLTVTPMMIAHTSRRGPVRPGPVSRALEAALTALTRAYVRTLVAALRFPRSLLLLNAALVALTVWLFIVLPKGFFPEQDTALLAGTSTAAPSTSYARMVSLQQQAVAVVLRDPAVAAVSASVGGGFMGGGTSSGDFFVALRPLVERGESASAVIERLREPLAQIVGVEVSLRSMQDLMVGGRSGRAQFQYTLLSASTEELGTWTRRLVERLRRVPQLADVSSDQDEAGPETHLTIDRDAARRLGVSAEAISQTLQDGFAQRQVSTIYRPQNQYYVVLEVTRDVQQDPTQIERLFVGASDGTQVPLSRLVRVEWRTAASRVTHHGGLPAATIFYNLRPGVALGEADRLLRAAQDEIGMPASVWARAAGTAAAQQSFTADVPLLIAGAILSIYVVLGVLYESYVHPLTILSTLPTAGVGALLALGAAGEQMTIVAVIAIILLMGIVKKNAIMLVDFALQHEKERAASSLASILAACRDRFRPILMTTLAAMLGAAPLAASAGVGAELRRPLGIAIIGGLALSQLLTLYTTPAVYLALDALRRRGARLAGRGGTAAV